LQLKLFASGQKPTFVYAQLQLKKREGERKRRERERVVGNCNRYLICLCKPNIQWQWEEAFKSPMVNLIETQASHCLYPAVKVAN